MKKVLPLFLLLSFLLSSCMKDHTNDSPLLGVSVSDVVLNSDETKKDIEIQSTFVGILSRTEDVSTHQEASWLKVVLSKGKITLNLEENISVNDRQAKVTLYMGPNRDNISDPDIEVEFLVTQKKNDQFDGLNISELVMSHAAADSTIVLSKNVKNAKVVVESVDDSETVKWCSARLNGGTELTVKVGEYKSRGVRQALSRLLPGNNKVQTDSLTATTAFLVTQKENNVFEGFNATDVKMPSDASEATLTFNNELTGIKSVMIDSATNEPVKKWLTLKIEGKKVLLTAQANASLTDRKAKITLYYPNNGATIDSTTVQTTFNVRQGKKDQIVLEKSSLTVSYEAQTVELSVTSNVGITIKGAAINEQRIGISGYHVEGTTHKIILSFKENKTENIIEDKLSIVSSSNNAVKADLLITQKTNPAITLFDGENKNWSFRKDGGKFQLLVSTLTPDYQVVKKESWITVGSKMRESQGKYYHEITISNYTGEGPLRTDTIFVKNAEVTKKFVVSQDKYLYLSESEVKVEVGKTHQLHVTNKTSNSVVWSSGSSSIASVNSNGLITANKRGSTQIKASIGTYKLIPDYSDKCTVKVFDASDSVLVNRNYGDYVKTNGYVTADCPITIHNNYHLSATIKSVTIVGDNGSTIIQPTTENIVGYVMKTGSSLVVNFPKVNHVNQPKVKVVFTIPGGAEYTSQTDY